MDHITNSNLRNIEGNEKKYCTNHEIALVTKLDPVGVRILGSCIVSELQTVAEIGHMPGIILYFCKIRSNLTMDRGDFGSCGGIEGKNKKYIYVKV